MLLRRVLQNTAQQRHQEREAELYRNLIRREAKIGGELFGPIPDGTRREFFCLDEHTWVWHEEWIDQDGRQQVRNTRYDIRPNGILKAQNGQDYREVTIEEAERLVDAIKIYTKRVRSELYAPYV